MFQGCRGGHQSWNNSFGVGEVVPMIVPNPVLLVMLEMGWASGKVTFFDFFGDSNPEMVGWRFTNLQGVQILFPL